VQTITVQLEVVGGSDELAQLIRNWVRIKGGGNVQAPLGRP
jgi:hypothetical protein